MILCEKLPKYAILIYAILSTAYAMSITSIFTGIMEMISNSTIFFIFSIFIFKLFSTNIEGSCLFIWLLDFVCYWLIFLFLKIWNIITYFFCRWLFKIIMTSIHFLLSVGDLHKKQIKSRQFFCIDWTVVS